MSEELTILLDAMRCSGAAILKVWNTNFSVKEKSNKDIVTEADYIANDILKEKLLGHFPEDGWLSEESADNPARLTMKRVWVIDPIDGTREFATGIPEYAISVALVEHHSPIISAIFNPVTNELFYAVKGQGAWLGDKRLHCRSTEPAVLSLLASRSEYTRGEWKQFETHHHVTQVGSIAYKLALIAAGRADATFSLGPKSEWDVAAGALIVNEAGGVVTNQRGEPLLFNQSNVIVDGIVATSATSNKAIYALINPSITSLAKHAT